MSVLSGFLRVCGGRRCSNVGSCPLAEGVLVIAGAGLELSLSLKVFFVVTAQTVRVVRRTRREGEWRERGDKKGEEKERVRERKVEDKKGEEEERRRRKDKDKENRRGEEEKEEEEEEEVKKRERRE